MAADSIQLYARNRADAAVLSGGSWSAALPLANLQSSDLYRVARSTSASLASTKFFIAFDQPRSFRGLFAGPTNIPWRHSWRVRSYSTGAFSTVGYDSGWIERVARVPFGTWPYGAPWLSDGIAHWSDGFRPGPWIMHFFDQPTAGQYWSLEIDASLSQMSYVEIGRLFMADYLIPSMNYTYQGNGLSYENGALSQATLDGGRRVLERKNRRLFRFTFDYLPEDEAFGAALPFVRDAGFAGEVFVVPDPTDAAHLQDRAFLGRLESADALTQSVVGRAGFSAQIREI